MTTYTTRAPVAQAVVPVELRSRYTIAFAAAGQFTAVADCNTVTGRWTATANGGLSIVPGPSTIVACPDGSYSDLYVLALSMTVGYAISPDGLTLTLSEGGTIGFEPIP